MGVIMNVVMLGKTVPEPTNERLEHYVCSAGYSPEHGLVRMYPLGLQGTPRRWSVNNVPVERFPGNKDSRPETWRPVGAFGQEGTLPVRDRRSVLEKFVVPGIVSANEQRLSLAVVRPIRPVFRLADSKLEGEPSYELYGESEALKARERFAHQPRLKFLTEDGKPHDLQVRDWGVWELMRKQHAKLASLDASERVAYVGGSLRITEDTLLLIGNYAQYRNSWLIISALNTP